MTSAPRKPRGRPQERTAKDAILAILATAPFLSAPAIAKQLGMHPKCAREHLRLLQATGEVHKITSSMPVYWSLDAPETDAQGEWCDPMMRIKQTVKPVGTWRVDHIPAVASVFQLGAV